jgi:FkbH-like protein
VGGVIGDDGVEGIVLGQGSAAGEAFLAFQAYAKDLAKRGVILAVCSKNDEANAVSAFEQHPEMVLRRSDVACFIANWDDKATNIRTIAQQLDIGLDSLVFVDDNPFERNLVRTALPMVAVPELPDDPALYATCLADAGYFEGLGVTDEDRERTRHYQSNTARAHLKAQAMDQTSYLRQLEMKLVWRRFDKIGLQRIVQLINKTNQFNLTTRRYTEADVLAVMGDPAAFGLQFRLLDRFGDNGMIAVVIGRRVGGADIMLDIWLMSCRVLGRGVEEAILDVVIAETRHLEGRRLIGVYSPTAKNAMVRDHYPKLGFVFLEQASDGTTRHQLDIETYMTRDFCMTIAAS